MWSKEIRGYPSFRGAWSSSTFSSEKVLYISLNRSCGTVLDQDEPLARLSNLCDVIHSDAECRASLPNTTSMFWHSSCLLSCKYGVCKEMSAIFPCSRFAMKENKMRDSELFIGNHSRIREWKATTRNRCSVLFILSRRLLVWRIDLVDLYSGWNGTRNKASCTQRDCRTSIGLNRIDACLSYEVIVEVF
jgi:hypothetical protein